MQIGWNELTRISQGSPVVVERVRLVGRDISVEGNFEVPPLANLSGEDQIFVAAFVRSHGSIKQMEQLFGVSYPTIKNRLNRIGGQLKFVDCGPLTSRDEVLSQLERGELSVEQALEMLGQ